MAAPFAGGTLRFRRYEALLQQALQDAVERRGLHLQDVFGSSLDELADAVQRHGSAQRQGFEHEQFEGSRRNVGYSVGSHVYYVKPRGRERDNGSLRVVLVSTYDLGHQPFGLASPAAWLRRAGHAVTCADLACGPLPRAEVRAAALVAFFLPMHTATRLAARLLPRVRALNPRAHLCCYGLYASMNEGWLRELGAASILGGEFESGLVDLAARLEGGPAPGETRVSLARQSFLVPDRSTLPPLAAYAHLRRDGRELPVGYTEATRGCLHLCRHCPVVPVYGGAFRVVQRDVVLADIRQQVEAGARHITFGDPDFLNGPGHAMALVEAFADRFPGLTYDVTVKVEHLLRHRALLPVLRRTGCLFVTSAVESVDDAVLARLDKGHTRAGFVELAPVMREAGLALAPTFVPFTPWTTREGYRDLLRLIARLDLVENVAPIQLAIRLLIPAGSRLLELPEVQALAGPFDRQSLVNPWRHPDPELDRLSRELQDLVKRQDAAGATRTETFARIWAVANDEKPPDFHLPARAAIPYLTEPWYC